MTKEGELVGRIGEHGTRVFLGVPFAAPPVGPLRWREATPPKRHASLQATEFELPCSQIPLPEGGDALGVGKKIPSSEDCLYLNVKAARRRVRDLRSHRIAQ